MITIQQEMTGLIDELLYFGSTKKYSEEVEIAHSYFNKGVQETSLVSVETGFSDWYIHNYKFADKFFLVDHFRKEKQVTDYQNNLLDSISNSVLSIFQILGEKGSYFLKDIFTQQDFTIDDQDQFESVDLEQLIFVRLYSYQESVYLGDYKTTIGMNFKDVLKKSFLEKYNEYTKIAGVIELDIFTYENPIILYKIVHILIDLDAESGYDDETYNVHQSAFVYNKYTNRS